MPYYEFDIREVADNYLFAIVQIFSCSCINIIEYQDLLNIKVSLEGFKFIRI